MYLALFFCNKAKTLWAANWSGVVGQDSRGGWDLTGWMLYTHVCTYYVNILYMNSSTYVCARRNLIQLRSQRTLLCHLAIVVCTRSSLARNSYVYLHKFPLFDNGFFFIRTPSYRFSVRYYSTFISHMRARVCRRVCFFPSFFLRIRSGKENSPINHSWEFFFNRYRDMQFFMLVLLDALRWIFHLYLIYNSISGGPVLVILYGKMF